MMEQMYRRNRERSRTQSRSTPKKAKPPYKQTLIRQSLFCLVVFVGCLGILLSENPKAERAKQTIRLIIETKTDFAAMPKQLGDFFQALFSTDPDAPGETDIANLILPIDAPVTSPFGLRTDPNGGREAFHYGVDLGGTAGDKIKCAATGKAIEVSENADYGKFVLVEHSGGVMTLYAHCAETLPQAGDEIARGQVIATVGATGNATAPHLHFEIRKGDTWLDPADFLEFDKND